MPDNGCPLLRRKMMIFGDQIKGVIFDIDGVLIDSMGIWTDLGARYVRSRGGEPEDGLAQILFSMSMEQGAEYIRDHYFPDLAAGSIVEGIQGMLQDFYYYEVQAKPGAETLMRSLRDAGIRITAATSSPRRHVEKALERNGLLGYVERIFTNSEVGVSKHEPDIYDLAAASMGLERGEVCVFEDSLYALRTAADAGYHTVGVYDEQGEPDQEGLEKAADIYIRSYSELQI